MKKTIFSFLLVLSVVCVLSPAHADAPLFDLPGLSQAAKDSLVAHYDGRTGVELNHGVVYSWTPVDGNGKPLAPMKVTATGGNWEGVTYDSSTATLKFDDTNGSTRSLVGTLGNTAGGAFTVFWKGCYDPTAPDASSGTYAYNIGPNKISHQRDDASGGRWIVELYNGYTYGGDDITAYDDVPATVWSTVITANSHKAYANGTNLNVSGRSSNSVPANAEIRIGAFSGKGYDLQGDISQFIVFQSALSDEDRKIVENYLSQIAVGGPSVDSNKSGYFGSEEIRVVFLNGPGNAGDKIAVLPAGAVPGQSAPLFETPTSGTSGKVTFSSTKLPSGEGDYALWHLSSSNGVISGPTSLSINPKPTLAVDKARYEVGEAITASFTRVSGFSGWIGIYQAHITPNSTTGRLAYHYIDPSYTDAAPTPRSRTLYEDSIPFITSYVIPPGEYKAWFFPDGSGPGAYIPVASSGPFTVTPTSAPPAWQAEPIRLRHGVTRTPYAARLHPYLSQKNNDGTYTDGTHTFKKISGPAWLAVAANGDISGTPGAADAGLNTFTIRAASTITRRSSDVSIDIPVFLPGQENVPRLSVMSYNIWHQMGMVHNGRRKGIESIARSGADIIGLQESSTSNANCLADELGWHRAIGPNDTQIISRYPVSEDSHGAVHIKARIHLSGNPRHDVIVYNCHLHYQSYAPYDGPGRTVEELLQKDANSRRLPEIRTILADMSASLAKADDTPVIFTGDFNCPSHLDWTAAAAHLHYDIGPVVWPTSKAVTDAGMLDSYRVAHPDPVASPGNTWSPIYIMPRTENDRIDFIYYKGSGLKVLSSEVFPGGEVQGVRYRHYTNIWPSDHAAVISVFSLDSVDSDK